MDNKEKEQSLDTAVTVDNGESGDIWVTLHDYGITIHVMSGDPMLVDVWAESPDEYDSPLGSLSLPVRDNND
jgi:hypothetical protein